MLLSKITLFTALSLANAKLGIEKSHRKLPKDETKFKKFRDDPFARFSGKFESLINLNPVNVGDVHNAVFSILGEAYTDEPPSNDFDVMNDVGEVMSSFCPRTDALCDAMVYKATLEEFSKGNRGLQEVTYPKGFNKEIQESLQIGADTIDLLNQNNKEEVADMLTVIRDDVENMQNVDQNEKALGVASLSIALGSLNLWHEVYTNEAHPLNQLVAGTIQNRRRLDETEAGDIITFEVEGTYWNGIFQLIGRSTKADFFGSVNGGTELIASVPENPLLIWPHNIFFSLVSVSLFHAIPASAQFVFGSNSTALFPGDEE